MSSTQLTMSTRGQVLESHGRSGAQRGTGRTRRWPWHPPDCYTDVVIRPNITIERRLWVGRWWVSHQGGPQELAPDIHNSFQPIRQTSTPFGGAHIDDDFQENPGKECSTRALQLFPSSKLSHSRISLLTLSPQHLIWQYHQYLHDSSFSRRQPFFFKQKQSISGLNEFNVNVPRFMSETSGVLFFKHCMQRMHEY